MSAPVTAIAHGARTLKRGPISVHSSAGRAVGVADQPIGDHEGAHVHRTRGRNAEAQVAEARRGPGWSSCGPGSAMRIMRSPADPGRRASTRAAIASYSARPIGRKRTRSPARRRIGSAARRIVESQPACGRATRSRPGSRPSRCRTACRRCPTLPGGTCHARRVEPRESDALGHAGHVRQARREAHEVHEVLGARVQPHQLVGGEAEPLGRRRRDREPSSGVVAARQLDHARGRQHLRPACSARARGASRRPCRSPGERIVVDEERAKAGHGLDDAGNAPLLDQVLQRQHPRVDLYADLVAELDGDGADPRPEGGAADARALRCAASA